MNTFTLYEVIKKQAQVFPDHTVFITEDQSRINRSELFGFIDSGRKRLAELGISRFDRVAFVNNGDIEATILLLSIMSITTCAPMRPLQSATEFVSALKSLKATIVIIEAGLSIALDAAKNLDLQLIKFVPHGKSGMFVLIGNTERKNKHETQALPDDIALLLHTSGSTSQPKLVPLLQRSLCITAWNTAQALELSSQDCCLNFLPLFHVHGLISCLMAPLIAGGSIICLPGFETKSFFHCLRTFQPTWYSASPPIHQIILRAIQRQNNKLHIPSLRFIRSGSAVLPPRIIHELEGIFGIPVIEAYGMTEAPNITGNPVDARKIGSVGKSVGPEIVIFDQTGETLKPNQPGEIAVCGLTVTPRYENNPKANAEAFYKGWFKTGDTGWLDDEGYLYLSGRKSEVVNRGGDKIAPSEIDQVLSQHPQIEQAVAFPVPHPSLGEDLAAAVVLKSPDALTKNDILRFLRQHLSLFKIPSRIVFLDEMPRGATGKVQRKRLSQMCLNDNKAGFVASRTELEHYLTNLWRKILGIEKVGIHDNFFELGGDSIKGTIVINQIQEKLSEFIVFGFVRLFDAPTVAEFAAYLKKNHVEAVSKIFKTEKIAEITEQLDEGVMSTLSTQGDRLSLDNPELLDLLQQKKGINDPQPQTITWRTEAGPAPLSYAQERLRFLARL
ncbi:MAG: hypothetical protein D3916_02460, partial [Candidatus Electrothrix sp. MAN1_4]|nr:hypothetical protein [Candidatus Electrothrix sp. MAN1_4]